jgi:hypothetical protein
MKSANTSTVWLKLDREIDGDFGRPSVRFRVKTARRSSARRVNGSRRA